MKILLSIIVVISGFIWAFPSLSESLEKKIREKTCRRFKVTRTAYLIYQLSLAFLVLLLPIGNFLRIIFFVCQYLAFRKEIQKLN